MFLAYPLWLLIFGLLPFAAVLYYHEDVVRDHWRVFSLAVFGSFIFGVPWDHIAIKNGFWSFPKEAVIGLDILSIPLEEYLFMASVTVNIAAVTLISWERWGEEL